MRSGMMGSHAYPRLAPDHISLAHARDQRDPDAAPSSSPTTSTSLSSMPSSMRWTAFGLTRTKQFALNLLLAVASTACAYAIIELLFFRLFLPYLSLNLMIHLPDTAGVLVQNSKSGFVPHDYVALLGDSYAEGVGDWLWQAHANRAKPYHSANVIHEATGGDVVSFGRAGAG